MQPTVKSRTSGWLELLRPPNLLTVPGDPIAGYFLAMPALAVQPRLLATSIATSVCWYVAGLILNDVVDFEEDRHDRPQRPLPSRRVARSAALTVAILLFVVGGLFALTLGAAARWMALALLLSILIYDLGGKKVPILGAVNMGLCRGFSLLLGAAAAAGHGWCTPPPTLAFDVLVVYVASVSHLAREEASLRKAGGERWIPAFVIAGSFALLSRLQPPTSLTAMMVFCCSFLFACALALLVADTLELAVPEDRSADPQPLRRQLRRWIVPDLIGLLLGAILLVQAGLIMVSQGGEAAQLAGVFLLAAWPFHRILSRSFYAS